MKLSLVAILLLQCCDAKKHKKHLRKVRDEVMEERRRLQTTNSRVFPVEADDIGMRFNKYGAEMTPLEAVDYPLAHEKAIELRKTKAVSIINIADCDECYMPIWRLIQQIGGLPSHPSSNPSSPFWKEMVEVTDMQFKRKQNVKPHTFMPLPKIWQNYTIHDVAKAVHNEFPGVHHINLIKTLLADGATVDRKMIPSLCDHDFLRSVVMLSDMNTWSIAKVGPMNFGVKWYAGRARPEEVAYAIAQGKIGVTDGVPAKLLNDIKSMGLTNATSYTAYPEGSPRHPSWPAMHSAASAGSMWISTVLNLTPEQYCEVQKVDYAISYARTVAGVHYPTDNTAGLNLGQQVLARHLPFYLHQKYGAKRAEIRRKIAKYIFDWNTFTESECFKGGVEATA